MAATDTSNLEQRQKIYTNLEILADMRRSYESIFSWEIYEILSKIKRTHFFSQKINEKLNLLHYDSGKFSLDLFYLNLISIFEMFCDCYLLEAYEKIKHTIFTLEHTRCAQSDTFFGQISDACFHIAYATQAYIMIHLCFDVQKLQSKIKPKCKFNKLEKAAIYGIKALVYLEYSPEGNNIGLDLAESAKKINCMEIEWINIWLKAKRRKRRSDKKPSFPSKEELEAAKRLSKAKTNLECLTSAASLYAEAAFALSLIRSRYNLRDSKKYSKLVVDLIKIVFHSANKNLKLLYDCLSCISNISLSFIPKGIVNEIVGKLSNYRNYKIQYLLGKYYLKIKDYKKANDYFNIPVLRGSISASLLSLKVNYLLKNVDRFSLVHALKRLYHLCPCLKKKCFISALILMYYLKYEKNDMKLLLVSLNTYLNEQFLEANYKNFQESWFSPWFGSKQVISSQYTFIRDIDENIQKLIMYGYIYWDSDNMLFLNNIVKQFQIIFNCVSNTEIVKENTYSKTNCVICHTAKARFSLQPCGHQCTCKNCWDTLKNNTNVLTCYICNTIVDYYLICI